jgi:hypothetical protein
MAKYSARQTKMRKGAKSGRRFIQLFTNVKRSEAYHGLSLPGRAALFELIDRYNGCNNGMIALGVRELACELNCSKDTAARALNELDDAGLAHPTSVGAWRGKKSSEWRLLFKRCDKTGDLPVTNWKQRPPYEPKRADGRFSVRPIGHRRILSPTHRTSGTAQSDPSDAKAEKPNEWDSRQSDPSDTCRSIPQGRGLRCAHP